MNATQTNTTTPAEYAYNSHPHYQKDTDAPFNYYNSHIATEMVKALIKARLESEPMAQTVRDSIDFDVRMVGGGYGTKANMTRVYCYDGAWKKTFVSSKKNESIDMEKAIAFIVKNAESRNARRIEDQKKTVNRKTSEVLVNAIKKQVGYVSGLYLYGSDRSDDTVMVSYKATLSYTHAAEVARFIANLK